MLSTEQILLIKRSWKLFRAIDPVIVADTFYSKLFADHPALRKMFPDNMDQQYRKLVDMLNTIVARLERIDEMKEEIAEMGRRHAGYGVRPGHYKLVGRALLWTLEKGLGTDCTAKIKEAWITCYGLLADTMIRAEKKFRV